MKTKRQAKILPIQLHPEADGGCHHQAAGGLAPQAPAGTEPLNRAAPFLSYQEWRSAWKLIDG